MIEGEVLEEFLERNKPFLIIHSIIPASTIISFLPDPLSIRTALIAIVCVSLYNFIMSLILFVTSNKDKAFLRLNITSILVFLVWWSLYLYINDGYNKLGLGFILLAIGFSLMVSVFGTFDLDELKEDYDDLNATRYISKILCNTILFFGFLITSYALLIGIFTGNYLTP